MAINIGLIGKILSNRKELYACKSKRKEGNFFLEGYYTFKRREADWERVFNAKYFSQARKN